MIAYTFDTESIDSMVASLGGLIITVAIAIYQTCKTYGITWDVAKTKMLVRSDAAVLIKHQDDDIVVKKLVLSDELVQFLQEIAPNPDGTINTEVAMDRIKTCIAWQNVVIQNDNMKKLKPLEMKKV